MTQEQKRQYDRDRYASIQGEKPLRREVFLAVWSRLCHEGVEALAEIDRLDAYLEGNVDSVIRKRSRSQQ